jgi:hypothetical protein
MDFTGPAVKRKPGMGGIMQGYMDGGPVAGAQMVQSAM